MSRASALKGNHDSSRNQYSRRSSGRRACRISRATISVGSGAWLGLLFFLMRTQYEIRNPRLDGIYISFDTEWEALRFWRENVEHAAETNRIYGAVVVRHSWESKSEAETARLNWLLGTDSGAALVAECARAPSLYQNADTWLAVARTAIDVLRKAPPSTVAVIWPNSDSATSR